MEGAKKTIHKSDIQAVENIQGKMCGYAAK